MSRQKFNKICRKSFDAMNRKEVLRYFGVGNKETGAPVDQLVDEAIEAIEKAATPRWTHQYYPVSVSPDWTIDMTFMKTTSRNLGRNLTGCNQIALFAATLGIGVDILIRKYERFEISRAAALQAAAAAKIEEVCDEFQEQIGEEITPKGLFMRPRYSPGYGDFLLTVQRAIITTLNATKLIGISLTDSMMMIPSKSVTAVIGLSPIDKRCPLQGCEICTKKDCLYRR